MPPGAYPSSAASLAQSAKPRCDCCDCSFQIYDPKRPLRCSPCIDSISEWLSARSWSSLVSLNRKFITNERRATPYSRRQIFRYPDMRVALLRLHDYGIVVTDAQPEMRATGQDARFKEPWYEVQDRAYLRIVIPTRSEQIPPEKIDLLIVALLSTHAFECVVYGDYGEYHPAVDAGYIYRSAFPLSTPDPDKLDLRDFPKHRLFFSSFLPRRSSRYVAKHRYALTADELVWQTWRKCPGHVLPVTMDTDLRKKSLGKRAFGRELKAARPMEPIIITIARTWAGDKFDIAAHLENTCIWAGLKRVFAEKADARVEHVAKSLGKRSDGADVARGVARSTPEIGSMIQELSMLDTNGDKSKGNVKSAGKR